MTQEEIVRLPKRKFLLWLKSFVSRIPKEEWCIGTRDDHKGHHCVLGFIDKEFGDSGDNFSNSDIVIKTINSTTIKNGSYQIVYSNNGRLNVDLRIRKLDNPKDRVLKHINLMLANKI